MEPRAADVGQPGGSGSLDVVGAADAAGRSCAAVCEECGIVGSLENTRGLQVCQHCGAVKSFSGALEQSQTQAFFEFQSRVDRFRSSRPSHLLTVTADRRQWVVCKHMDKKESALNQRIQRCRQAIVMVAAALQVQESVCEPSLALIVRYSQRVKRLPGKGEKLKHLVSACMLVISTRQALGLGLREVAARAGVKASDVSKSVWKVCKVCGLRLRRTPANAEAMMQRICDHLEVRQQRAALVAAALRLLRIAEDGWITTGRHWAQVVAACLLLASEAYFCPVALDSVAAKLAVAPDVVRKRLRELKAALVSLMRVLPWGRMVTSYTVHTFMLFAVEHYDLLKAAAPALRKRQLDAAADLVARPPHEREPTREVGAAPSPALAPLPEQQVVESSSGRPDRRPPQEREPTGGPLEDHLSPVLLPPPPKQQVTEARPGSPARAARVSEPAGAPIMDELSPVLELAHKLEEVPEPALKVARLSPTSPTWSASDASTGVAPPSLASPGAAGDEFPSLC